MYKKMLEDYGLQEVCENVFVYEDEDFEVSLEITKVGRSKWYVRYMSDCRGMYRIRREIMDDFGKVMALVDRVLG